MFPIHLEYILGTHRKNSSASFFDPLDRNSEVTAMKVLLCFLPAFCLHGETKLHTKCSLHPQTAESQTANTWHVSLHAEYSAGARSYITY